MTLMARVSKANELIAYHKAALTADDVGRLRHISPVQQVVVRISKLAVADLKLRQEVFQHLVVDLTNHNAARQLFDYVITNNPSTTIDHNYSTKYFRMGATK